MLCKAMLQAGKEDTIDSPGLPPGGGLNFCVRSTTLAQTKAPQHLVTETELLSKSDSCNHTG